MVDCRRQDIGYRRGMWIIGKGARRNDPFALDINFKGSPMARCHLRHSFRGGCHRELSFAVGRQPSGGEQPAAPQIGGSILPRIPDHLSRISTRLIADTGCVKSCLLRKTPSKADRRLYLSLIVINHNIRQFKVYFPKESDPCPVSIDIHRRHSPGKVSKPFSGSQSQRAGRDRLSAGPS